MNKDHPPDAAYRERKGVLFNRADGRRAMIRCVECGVENYALAVYDGVCAWCGYDANAEDERDARQQ